MYVWYIIHNKQNTTHNPIKILRDNMVFFADKYRVFHKVNCGQQTPLFFRRPIFSSEVDIKSQQVVGGKLSVKKTVKNAR